MREKKQWIMEKKQMIWDKAFLYLFLLTSMLNMPVTAEAADKKDSQTGSISSAFNSIYQIISAIVTSIGQLYLLWGVFEWATALNSQDGSAQSMAFKRIAAGLVACMAPTIISMIKY